jgi:hypothetical protein
MEISSTFSTEQPITVEQLQAAAVMGLLMQLQLVQMVAKLGGWIAGWGRFWRVVVWGLMGCWDACSRLAPAAAAWVSRVGVWLVIVGWMVWQHPQLVRLQARAALLQLFQQANRFRSRQQRRQWQRGRQPQMGAFRGFSCRQALFSGVLMLFLSLCWAQSAAAGRDSLGLEAQLLLTTAGLAALNVRHLGGAARLFLPQ